jgi:hypothetical protein
MYLFWTPPVCPVSLGLGSEEQHGQDRQSRAPGLVALLVDTYQRDRSASASVPSLPEGAMAHQLFPVTCTNGQYSSTLRPETK